MISLQKFRKPQVGLSNEAVRNIWLKKTLAKIPKKSKILDAGAGEQQFKKYCKHLKYTSQDVGIYSGEGNSKGLQTKKWDFGKLDIVSDIVEIPRADNSFDAIMCTEVFEHIPDPLAAIQEFARLLKPGGDLIITAPYASLTHFAPYHFYSGFNSYFYEHNLKATGFEIIEVDRNGNYFEYLAQEVQRLPSVSTKYSKVNLNIWEKIARLIVLSMLNKMSSMDTNSDELLCFGYHIWAKKL